MIEPFDAIVVTRVHTDTGSHIEPPLDDRWSPLRKLQWQAAVVAHDTGLAVTVDEPSGDGDFSVQVGNSCSGPHYFSDAWTYLSGVSMGARAMA